MTLDLQHDKTAYEQPTIFNTMRNRVVDLRLYSVDDNTWNKAANICQFLKSAALLI